MPGSRSERASRTSRKASVRWFVVRAREQGPSNERPDPYRSYLYKVAEKESKSMDINELSLMDVVHLNDTRKLTPGPDGLKLEGLTTRSVFLLFEVILYGLNHQTCYMCTI